MKRVVKFLMVVVAAVAAFGCSEPDNNGTIFLDVTHNNIKGVWRLESYDNGVQLAQGSYYYIVFDRAERTFVSYDNTESMEVCKRTGRYDIYTDGAAIIFGDYDYGLGPNDWEHRYYVRNLTTDSMQWVATDDESIVQVYVRAELPEGIAK
ncbi:MAG: lipocalin family protein [Alistipes sp.]|nr:lipocalin family protein [Alistipes sp.]